MRREFQQEQVKNIARHRRTCETRAGVAGRREEAMEERRTRVYVPQVAPCPNCRRVLSKTNMARHMRSCGARAREWGHSP